MSNDASENQLPLAISLQDNCTFESYFPGPNAHIINIIKQAIAQNEDAFIYLWGREGVGCSHLLQAACHYATELGQSALYLPLNKQIRTGFFQDLERTDLICLDNLDAVTGDPILEEALFDLYNRLKASKKKMLIAAKQPPKGAKIQLADLRSRLEWGIACQVHVLSEGELVKAVLLRAEQRGIVISREVVEFIINRVTRSMGALYALLETLDRAQLKHKRHLTIPFVKKILRL